MGKEKYVVTPEGKLMRVYDMPHKTDYYDGLDFILYYMKRYET